MKLSKVSPRSWFLKNIISALVEISPAVGVKSHLGRSAPGRKTLTTPLHSLRLHPSVPWTGRVDDIRAPFHRRLWRACAFVSVKDVKGIR